MNKINVPIILGASRPGSRSGMVAEVVERVVSEHGLIETELVGVDSYEVPFDEDSRISGFGEVIERADALILVFPEYNHSFPGRLKTLLDTEYDAYRDKPVMLVSVSSGDWGGVRGVESIIPYLVTLGLIVTRDHVHVARVKEMFDNEGKLVDGNLERRVKWALERLVYLTRVMREGKRVVE